MKEWARQAHAALSNLEWYRRRFDRLGWLHERMTTEFSGKRCLVLGSAPGAVAPDMTRIDACLCVNGSPWTAARLGIDRPDMTVVVGHKTQVRDHEVVRATLDAWRGLRTRILLFVAIGDNPRHARAVFAEADFRYETFISIRPDERAAIIEQACSKQLAMRGSRVSNGIFAAIVAMWAGAREIVFSGFSLKGGHSYIDHETRRGHQHGDSLFFQMAKDFTCPVTTTSDELHREFGLPLSS